MQATGVIMAGGRSSRMRFNKAFAEINGQPVICFIINKFINTFSETIIISNDPEQYAVFNLPTYSDVYPRLGPVSGIHAALHYARMDKVFVLGCDMPFMSMGLARYMIEQLEDHEAAVPEIEGYLQPISAAYSKKCLSVLTNCLNNNLLKLVLVFNELNTRKIKESELRHFGDIREMFLNVNDPETLYQARILARRLL
ncbi:MAG: molybdenum cofactor guanylyltransferase [Syntrophomonadaceae bacterium]|jgi:molybdopterin-guanine dinucleotide biosynthesis protein A